MNKSYTRNIIQDPDTDDLILDLGDELCREAGWEVGDTLEWIDQKDGTWILRKAPTSLWKRFVTHLKNIVKK